MFLEALWKVRREAGSAVKVGHGVGVWYADLTVVHAGRFLVGAHRRSLKGCSALAIGVRGKTDQEEEAIAEAVSKAYASSEGCSNVEANAKVRVAASCESWGSEHVVPGF